MAIKTPIKNNADGGTPAAHASSHKGDGSDPIAAATTSVNGLLASTDKTFLTALQATPSTLTTAGTTITVDFANGDNEVIDLQGASGNVTLTLSNPTTNRVYTIKVIQGSTARNLVWPGTVKWAFGAAPTISTTNDAIDLITLFYDGTNYLASFNQAYA